MSQTAIGDKVNRFLAVRPVRFGYVVRLAIEKLPTWEGATYCTVEVILIIGLTQNRQIKSEDWVSSQCRSAHFRFCLALCVSPRLVSLSRIARS